MGGGRGRGSVRDEEGERDDRSADEGRVEVAGNSGGEEMKLR